MLEKLAETLTEVERLVEGEKDEEAGGRLQEVSSGLSSAVVRSKMFAIALGGLEGEMKQSDGEGWGVRSATLQVSILNPWTLPIPATLSPCLHTALPTYN